jgi:hypothetical protein
MSDLVFDEELRDKITETGKVHLRIALNSYKKYETFKYRKLWDDLETWAIANKYPSWRRQKNYIISIASEHGISMYVREWKKIFKIYDELYKKFYFLSWDIDCIPWLEHKIDVYSTGGVIV